jgi:glycosyltransferase involved in cell wall biosynthesis
VSVVTPVYNGEAFIAKCIESVQVQTYPNFEYIIINNCSKDRTLEIAKSYAAKDSRIRIHDNTDFVGVIANHNLAFSLIAPESKYCKVVSADDWIYPDCLTQMVALAEENPRVAMVGCYMLAGKQVMNTGLELEKRVVNGKEICRATLLGGPYVFGSPSSLLYRSDLLRKTNAFYPTPNPHSDTTAVFQSLENLDFGFVHQILAYAQIHSESQTSRSIKYGTIRRALIQDLRRVGPLYLSPDELKARLDHVMEYYYRWLVGALYTNRKDPEFWKIQKAELEEVGIELDYSRIGLAALRKGVGIVLRPAAAAKKAIAMSRKDPTKIEATYY